ncbi:hypothetical protein PS685_04558 [Pseudomonas fluorescens]|uniref:Uncharacterized protein n=1 Tax=Pseudomonas fluorescens TaxID=294 RepID=A0A5E6ZH69_PSEFL|nr:hypothetical protein PS685_04558 [Pseudomonas fluorescens]
MTRQVARIDRNGHQWLGQFSVNQRAFGQFRQQAGWQVVDAIETVVFKDGEGSAFTGAGASADYD